MVPMRQDFIDAVSEVKGLCPGVSFTAGVSNLSHGARTAAGFLRSGWS
jgi:cobalamin-dependent methionine synthase I